VANTDSAGGGSEEPDEAGDEEPAVDATRSGPHDRATVTAADAATADRLAVLEDSGAVDGYVPLVDYDALGLRTALLRIDAHHGNARTVADDLRDGPGVAVYLTSGRFDVLAVCRFPSAAAFERTATRLASDPRVRAHRIAVARHAVVEDGPLEALSDDD
jgi:DNA-binding Lrp family transcriptional regulator